MAVRQNLFRVAGTNPAIGPIHETLKWGDPAYLTPDTGSGSTIRLAWKSALPGMCGIYLNCQTDLIERMRSLYPNAFQYQGNRAALFPVDTPPDSDAVSHCLEMALTYHSAKQQQKQSHDR